MALQSEQEAQDCNCTIRLAFHKTLRLLLEGMRNVNVSLFAQKMPRKKSKNVLFA